MDKVTITTPSGITVTGTPKQVAETLNAMGVNPVASGFYISASKGLIAISDMDDAHIKDAILKHYLAWVKQLGAVTPRVVLGKIQEGIQDPVWTALVVELAKRYKT